MNTQIALIPKEQKILGLHEYPATDILTVSRVADDAGFWFGPAELARFDSSAIATLDPTTKAAIGTFMADARKADHQVAVMADVVYLDLERMMQSGQEMVYLSPQLHILYVLLPLLFNLHQRIAALDQRVHNVEQAMQNLKRELEEAQKRADCIQRFAPTLLAWPKKTDLFSGQTVVVIGPSWR